MFFDGVWSASAAAPQSPGELSVVCRHSFRGACRSTRVTREARLECSGVYRLSIAHDVLRGYCGGPPQRRSGLSVSAALAVVAVMPVFGVEVAVALGVQSERLQFRGVVQRARAHQSFQVPMGQFGRTITA